MAQHISKQTIIPFLTEIFKRRGAEEYLGKPATIGAHMLQAAYFDQQDGNEEIVIATALLHDVGHFTGDFIAMPLAEATAFMEDTKDRQHERAGSEVLDALFPELVVDCCRYHVAANRQLCAREPGYFEKLSAASAHSLLLQGGPMSADDVTAFELHPHFDATIAVRRYDELGFDVPGFASYLPILERLVAPA